MKLRLPPVLLFFGVVLALVLVAHPAAAQDFPVLGLGQDKQANMLTAFAVQWSIFKTNGGASSAVFYLALLGTLVGTMMMLFNPAMRKMQVFIPWAFLVLVMVFAPYNSKLAFYPLSGQTKGNTAKTSTGEIYGFTPQVVAAHLGNALTQIIYGATYDYKNVVQDAQDALALEGSINNIDIPSDIAKNYENLRAQGCGKSTDGSAAGDGTTAENNTGSSGLGYDASGLSNQVINEINNKLKSNRGDPTSILRTPMIGLYSELPNGNDVKDSKNASYIKSLHTALGKFTDPDTAAGLQKELDDPGKAAGAVGKSVDAIIKAMRTNGDYGPKSSGHAGWFVVKVDKNGKVNDTEGNSPINYRNNILGSYSGKKGGQSTQALNEIENNFKGQNDSKYSLQNFTNLFGERTPVARVELIGETGASNGSGGTSASKVKAEGYTAPNCEKQSENMLQENLQSALPGFNSEVIKMFRGESGATLSCMNNQPRNCKASDVCSNGCANNQRLANTAENIAQALNLSKQGQDISKLLQDRMKASADSTPQQANTVEKAGSPRATGKGLIGRAYDAVGDAVGMTTDPLNWFLSLLAKGGLVVLAVFAGIFANLFIIVLNMLIEVAVIGLVVITPFIFIMGLIIPTNASGMLFYTVVGIFILKLVPMTIHLINILVGVITSTIGAANTGILGMLDTKAQEAVVLLAAAVAYWKAVSLTFAILFKLGDANNITKLMSLDDAAKQIAELPKQMAQKAAMVAAAVMTGGATGALMMAGSALGGKGGAQLAQTAAGRLGRSNKGSEGDSGAELTAPDGPTNPGGLPAEDLVMPSPEGSGFISMNDYLDANKNNDGTVTAPDGRIMDEEQFLREQGIVPAGQSDLAYGTGGDNFGVVDDLGQDPAAADPDAWARAGYDPRKVPALRSNTLPVPYEGGGGQGGGSGGSGGEGGGTAGGPGTGGQGGDNAVGPGGSAGDNAAGSGGGIFGPTAPGTATSNNLRIDGGTLDSIGRVDEFGGPSSTAIEPGASVEAIGREKTVDELRTELNTVDAAIDAARAGTIQADVAALGEKRDEIAQQIELKQAKDLAAQIENITGQTVQVAATDVQRERNKEDTKAQFRLAADAGRGGSIVANDKELDFDNMSLGNRMKLGFKAGVKGYMEAAGSGLKDIPGIGHFLAEISNERKEVPIRARAMHAAALNEKASGGKGGGGWGAYSRLKKDSEMMSLIKKQEGDFGAAENFRVVRDTRNISTGFDNSRDSGAQAAASAIAAYEGRRTAQRETGLQVGAQDYFRKNLLGSIQNAMDVSKASIVIREGQFKFEGVGGKPMTTMNAMRAVASLNANYNATGFDSSITTARKGQIHTSHVFNLTPQQTRATTAFTAKLLDIAEDNSHTVYSKRSGGYQKAFLEVMEAQEKSTARKIKVDNFESEQVLRNYVETSKQGEKEWEAYRKASSTILKDTYDPRAISVNGQRIKLDNPESVFGAKIAGSIREVAPANSDVKVIANKGFASILHVVAHQNQQKGFIKIEEGNKVSSYDKKILADAVNILRTTSAADLEKTFNIPQKILLSPAEMSIFVAGMQKMTTGSDQKNAMGVLQDPLELRSGEMRGRRPTGKKGSSGNTLDATEDDA